MPEEMERSGKESIVLYLAMCEQDRMECRLKNPIRANSLFAMLMNLKLKQGELDEW